MLSLPGEKSDLSKRQTTMKLTSKHANLRVVVVHVKGDTPQLEQNGQCQLPKMSIVVLPLPYFDKTRAAQWVVQCI